MSKQFDVLSYIKTLIDNIDWVITLANKDIYFKYDAGSSTKITLIIGNYTTAGLITHLEALLDTAFTITSTITYSSNKFSIAVETGHTIQYIDTSSTLEIGFTRDSAVAVSITSDTSVNVHFQYVDYLTEKNVNKLGNRFPAVLVEDGDEEWGEGGAGSYDIIHYVQLYLLDRINQDRLETLLENQEILTDAINNNNTIGGYAVCTKIITVEKGNYYASELIITQPGYNNNSSVRRITVRIWEKV